MSLLRGNAGDRQMTIGEFTGGFGKLLLGLRWGRTGGQPEGGAEQTRALRQDLQGRRKTPFELKVSTYYTRQAVAKRNARWGLII